MLALVTPVLLISILIAIIIYVLILKNIASGDKFTAFMIALVAVLFVVGIMVAHYSQMSGNISLSMGGNLIYIIMGILLLVIFLRLLTLKKEEKGILLYFFPLSMLVIFLTPIVFFYFHQKGETDMGVKVGQYLGVISAIMLLISIFGLGEIGRKGEEKKGGDKEEGDEEDEIKNPFRELLEFVEKKKLFILLSLLPLVFSTGYIIIYHPEAPKEVLISDYENYSVSIYDTYTKVNVELPPGTESIEVTLVVLFDKGHYERKVLVKDNTTKIIYIEKVKGGYFTEIRNLFSMMGLYNFWLPMFIVFLIVYAILGKVLVISTKEGEIKEIVGKDVRMLIAFSIAIVFGASAWATKFVSTYLPYIGMGLVLILGVGMIISFIFPGGISEMVANPFIKNTFLYIGFSIFLVAFLFAAASLIGKSPREILSSPVYEDLTFGEVLVFGLFIGWIIVITAPSILKFLFGGGGK